MFDFIADKFYYLTVVLSNCTYNGSAFLNVESLFSLTDAIRDTFDLVPNLEFRGVGSSMVRGNTNSLTLGIAAGYFYNEQGLRDSSAETLRANIRSAISSISGLAYSEVRIETTITGKM